MIEQKYYECYKKWNEVEGLRREIVCYAKEYGISRAANKYATTRKTVRKWVVRYNKHEKLTDKSKIPKTSNNKITENYEWLIVYVCNILLQNRKRIFASMIKSEYSIPYSEKTILKVIHSHGFKKSINKKKHERKRDLREYKKKYKPFERIQIDVKYLDDIPEMYKEYREYDLPQYQYTARDVRTGVLYYCYARSYCVKNSTIFISLLTRHFKNYSLNIENTTIQTDNGTEFTNRYKKTIFTKFIEKNYKEHFLIPVGAKTWQSDVETSHRLIEDEFYSTKIISCYEDFFNKAHQYQINFNFNRFNKYKSGTPVFQLKDLMPDLNIDICNLKPVLLDDFGILYDNFVASDLSLMDTISG